MIFSEMEKQRIKDWLQNMSKQSLEFNLEDKNWFDFSKTTDIAERCALLFEASTMARYILTKAEHIDNIHSDMCKNSKSNPDESIFVVYRELWIDNILQCANGLKGIRNLAQRQYLYDNNGENKLSKETLVNMQNILVHDLKRFDTNISEYLFGKNKWDRKENTLYDEILTTHEFGNYNDSLVYSAYLLIKYTLADIIQFSRVDITPFLNKTKGEKQ